MLLAPRPRLRALAARRLSGSRVVWSAASPCTAAVTPSWGCRMQLRRSGTYVGVPRRLRLAGGESEAPLSSLRVVRRRRACSRRPPFSEDCLYLNVYTPALRDSHRSNRPVLVWILRRQRRKRNEPLDRRQPHTTTPEALTASPPTTRKQSSPRGAFRLLVESGCRACTRRAMSSRVARTFRSDGRVDGHRLAGRDPGRGRGRPCALPRNPREMRAITV